MKYAGFWVRLLAGFLDFLVFAPLQIVFIWWIESRSYAGTMILVIPYSLTYALCCIFFLAKYGQTPGKMIMRIRVTRLDGGQIGIREAALRHSVDVAFALISGIGLLLAIQKTGPDVFSQEYSWIVRHQLVMLSTPHFVNIAQNLSGVWIWSEMVVLLFNKKRRAIHDFIAGTIVIHIAKRREDQQSDIQGCLRNTNKPEIRIAPDNCTYEERITYYSLSDLDDIVHRIDRTKYPGRYDLVIREIERRNKTKRVAGSD